MKHQVCKQLKQSNVTTLKIAKRKQSYDKLVKRLSSRTPLDVKATINNTNSVAKLTIKKLMVEVVDTLVNNADDHWKEICDILYKTGKHKVFIKATKNLFSRLVSNNLTLNILQTSVPTIYNTALAETQQKENIKADSYCYTRIRACEYKDKRIVVPVYRINLAQCHWKWIFPKFEFFVTISKVLDGNITVSKEHDDTTFIMNFRQQNNVQRCCYDHDPLTLEARTPTKPRVKFVFAACITQYNLDVHQLLISCNLPCNIVSIISQYNTFTCNAGVIPVSTIVFPS